MSHVHQESNTNQEYFPDLAISQLIMRNIFFNRRLPGIEMLRNHINVRSEDKLFQSQDKSCINLWIAPGGGKREPTNILPGGHAEVGTTAGKPWISCFIPVLVLASASLLGQWVPGNRRWNLPQSNPGWTLQLKILWANHCSYQGFCVCPR